MTRSSYFQTENRPSTSSSKPDVPEPQPKFIPRPAPSLAGACELTDIKILLREWITTITGTCSAKCSSEAAAKYGFIYVDNMM